ncbi:dynein light chain Tctex-type 5-like [Mytilus edulis]|uniref:Uncharacterized protein n=1 Tax=Mytilus edulis TaxID=6550 RepID=A0A8S3TC34_MYTED|nr:unnamed protein product [Mytilus edulis]
METRLPRLSRFSNLVRNVIKSPHIFKREDDSSRTETSEEPKIRYENTYRIAPDDTIATKIVNSIMNNTILEVVSGEEEDFLDKEGRGFLCTRLSDAIRQRIKAEYFNSRFRIIVHVTIVQENATISVGSRCLWNDSTDTHTSVTVPFEDSVIVATCYMLYYE